MTPNQTLVACGNVFKKITLSLFLVVACNAFAQVGVGTQTPATTLDVVGAAGATPGALNTIDGIAVPVVTDDMTTTATAGSRISQLVYSNNAASTGYYFWNGTAWTALSGGAAAAARTVTVTASAAYAILLTDDIIEYTSTTPAVWTFPTGAAIGKTFTVVTTNQGQITISTATTASNTLPGNAGTTYTHLGADRYAALHSF